jgi:hypothetical protein
VKLETYKCDGCGKVKGEANKWYKLSIINQTLLLEPFDAPFGLDLGTAITKAFDLCGEGCVQKKLQEFMSTAHADSLNGEVVR